MGIALLSSHCFLTCLKKNTENFPLASTHKVEDNCSKGFSLAITNKAASGLQPEFNTMQLPSRAPNLLALALFLSVSRSYYICVYICAFYYRMLCMWNGKWIPSV